MIYGFSYPCHTHVATLLIIAPKFENPIYRQKINQTKIARMRTSHRLGNMVAVMANEQQQFESLVTQLMSPDNNIRPQAEVRKSSLFLVDSFYRVNYARNYIVALLPGICVREVHIAGGFEYHIHAMCKLNPGDFFDVFNLLQLLSVLKHCSSSRFFNRRSHVKITGYFVDILPTFFHCISRSFCANRIVRIREYELAENDFFWVCSRSF